MSLVGELSSVCHPSTFT